MQKLHHAIDNLENMAAVRYEEDKMMALTKTALLKAVQTAINRQMPGFERLPLREVSNLCKRRCSETIGKDF